MERPTDPCAVYSWVYKKGRRGVISGYSLKVLSQPCTFMTTLSSRCGEGARKSIQGRYEDKDSTQEMIGHGSCLARNNLLWYSY